MVRPEMDIHDCKFSCYDHHLFQDTLDKYSRRSDCFRRGASVIRSRCGQLDMNEDERVKGNTLFSSDK